MKVSRRQDEGVGDCCTFDERTKEEQQSDNSMEERKTKQTLPMCYYGGHDILREIESSKNIKQLKGFPI